jgi:hypothetical protein
MPNLVEKFDSFHGKIRDYINSQCVENYFSHACHKKLSTRLQTLTDAYNMKATGRTAGQSKLFFGLRLKNARLRRAVLKAATKAEPLFNIEPIESTSFDNAQNAQDTLNQNIDRTEFKRRVLPFIHNTVAKYGSGITYSYPDNKTERMHRLVSDGIMPQKQKFSEDLTVVENIQVHLLNYCQEPSIARTWESGWQGHIQRLSFGQLVSRIKANKESYISNQAVKILQAIEGGRKLIKNDRYFNWMKDDQSEAGADIVHFHGTIPIPGNEEAEDRYYAEVCNGEIIRFQDMNDLENIRRYSHLFLEPRDDFWWANTDAEYVGSHENYINLVSNMKADNVINELMRLIFYPKGMIDVGSINERWKNGGFMPYKPEELGGRDIRTLLTQYAPTSSNDNSLDQMLREVKESAQDFSRVDLARRPTQGGLNNKTATGAQMMEDQANIQEADLDDFYRIGIEELAKTNFYLLQEHLSDAFDIRTKANRPQRQLLKDDIMGVFKIKFLSSIDKNKMRDAIRLTNGINSLVNLASTQLPAFQNVNFEKPLRALVRALDMGDEDDIAPEAFTNDQMGGQRQMAPPALGGMIPAPGPAAPQGAMNVAA